MITKAKKLTFTTSDGVEQPTLEQAKRRELMSLCDPKLDSQEVNEAFASLVSHSREAIAILKFGLPRKPRTTKPPMGKKPRRNLKREMPEIPGV